MNLAGYIKLHRKMMNWRWKNHPPTLCLFIHLLLSASYEAERSGSLVLNPGQVVISRSSLSKETGLSEDQIRTALSHLQQTGEITVGTSKGCRNTLVTIQNWARYQVAPGESPSESPCSETPETQTEQGLHGLPNYGNPQVVPQVATQVDASPGFSPGFPPGESPSESPCSETPETVNGNGLQPIVTEDSPSQPPGESPGKSPTIYNKKIKKDKNIKKNKYGDFVLLTEDEYKKLVSLFGLPFTIKAIEVLDNYIGSKGDKYKSHYYTIRGWVKDAVQRDYHMRPQPEATTTNTAAGQPAQDDPLAAWGGSL